MLTTKKPFAFAQKCVTFGRSLTNCLFWLLWTYVCTRFLFQIRLVYSPKLYIFIFLFVFFFQDSVSQCSLGCPRTLSMDQAGIELKRSTYLCLLELKESITTTHPHRHFLWRHVTIKIKRTSLQAGNSLDRDADAGSTGKCSPVRRPWRLAG